MMTNDTVLLGGFGVLALGSIIWFLTQRLAKSDLSARIKRLSTYLMIGGFVVCVIMVMRWHAENYISEKQAGIEVNFPSLSKSEIGV
tara:strand:- start:108 stop:368 length:261 start_codon:yes stop_codon:yes gene_type:complete